MASKLQFVVIRNLKNGKVILILPEWRWGFLVTLEHFLLYYCTTSLCQNIVMKHPDRWTKLAWIRRRRGLAFWHRHTLSSIIRLVPVILSLYQECSQIPVNDIILFWGVVAKQTERSSTERSIQIQALSSHQQTWTPVEKDMPSSSPPSSTLLPLLFLPLSQFLKARLHHPWCPHFNNASEISHWLQDSRGLRRGEKRMHNTE